jgi:Tol biopolymer transport system component
VPTAGGEPRPLTAGPRANDAPRWSPDGRTLAFTADRKENGERQLHLLRLDSGEAQPLTDLDGDVHAPAWSPDGRRIAFLVEAPPTEEERRRKEQKDDVVLFEREPKFTRVWSVDVRTGRAGHPMPPPGRHGDPTALLTRGAVKV